MVKWLKKKDVNQKKIIGDNNNVNIASPNSKNNSYADCEKYKQEIESLKKQLALKDEIINLLKGEK